VGLAKLSGDIATARRKRNLTTVMMAERIGSAKSTYLKVEKDDPSVSMGVYATALFVLGFADAIGDVVDPSPDDVGLLLEAERLSKRVRPEKSADRSMRRTTHVALGENAAVSSRDTPVRRAGSAEEAAFDYDATPGPGTG
jgi:DNA-binding XRE family transcriptional regulator